MFVKENLALKYSKETEMVPKKRNFLWKFGKIVVY
jgi:hypothetical protein